MCSQLLSLLLASCLAIPATHFRNAQTASVDARLAAQNALFEELYQTDLKNAPERATAYGDYRYNDQLSDRSLAAIDRRHTADVANLARLQAIPTTGFPLSMPFDSVKHYEDYIARLHQIPRVLSQTTEVLRAGMKDNLMPVRFLLEKLPVQCQGIIDADPFLTPTMKYPAEISLEDQKRLTQQVTDAINTDVIPAYKSFAAFLRTEYAPQGRMSLSITSLADGQKRY